MYICNKKINKVGFLTETHIFIKHIMNTIKIKNNSVFLIYENETLEFSKSSKNYNDFIKMNGEVYYLVK